MDARFSGWRNKETWNVAMMLDENIDWVYGILDGYREDGISAADQKFMLADAILDRLYYESAQLRKSGNLIFALVSDPDRVDCNALASRYVAMNEDLHAGMDAIASRCTKKPEASNNRKSGATSKKPVKKAPSRRRRHDDRPDDHEADPVGRSSGRSPDQGTR